MGAILLDRDAVSGQQRTDEEHGELRKIEEKASRFSAGRMSTRGGSHVLAHANPHKHNDSKNDETDLRMRSHLLVDLEEPNPRRDIITRRLRDGKQRIQQKACGPHIARKQEPVGVTKEMTRVADRERCGSDNSKLFSERLGTPVTTESGDEPPDRERTQSECEQRVGE